MDAIFEKIDFLVTPTCPIVAPEIDATGGTSDDVEEAIGNSGTGTQQHHKVASPTLQRINLHSARHGLNRGIHRGTLARNAAYSAPNLRSSVGSS